MNPALDKKKAELREFIDNCLKHDIGTMHVEKQLASDLLLAFETIEFYGNEFNFEQDTAEANPDKNHSLIAIGTKARAFITRITEGDKGGN